VSSSSIWDRGTAEEKPSYVKEMLFSQTNVNTVLACLAGSALLAIPLGLAGFAVPMVLVGAGEAIASLFVPSARTFREKVDRKYRCQRRELMAAHLRREITRRAEESDPNWGVHQRLVERAKSLREMWMTHTSQTMTERDVERMEDASLDFLALWLANLSIYDRLKALNETDLQRRVAELRKRLEREPENRSLEKAKDDIEELLSRRHRLIARRAGVEAALIALPDAVEEIYQAAFTSPAASDVGGRLQEAVDRLHVEEELEQSFKDELEGVLPPLAPRAAATATAPARVRS
jgi:hypothetical protein